PTPIALLDTNNVSMASSGFRHFKLNSDLLRAIGDLRFEHPSNSISSMQAECLPPSMLGMNLICQPESGSGKTSIYVMATLNQLEGKEVEVFVVCPSREMARRINKEYEKFAKPLEIKVGF
ncbi:hypothetical protein PENTCL1PPCAC_5381, partial [Pristionchus entomophagus]